MTAGATGRGVVSQLPLALWLFFVAFAMMFIGMALVAFGSLANSASGVGGGAVILIGPIPIILGNGPNALPLIALAAVLTIFGLVFYLLLQSKARRRS